MARTFAVKNFEEFQHYKDRKPVWIKLYNDVLDDYDFGLLPDASKSHLIAIWLLASRYKNAVPYDAEWVAKRINATEPVDLDRLVKAGFLIISQGCSDVLAEPEQPASTETETQVRADLVIDARGRTRAQQEVDEFVDVYPRKMDEAGARSAYQRRRREGVTHETIMNGVARLIASGREERFMPSPLKFLEGAKWNDQYPEPSRPPDRRDGHSQILAALADGLEGDETGSNVIEGQFERATG